MSMLSAYREKSEALLRQAAEAADSSQRTRLIEEAAFWHEKADRLENEEPASIDGPGTASPDIDQRPSVAHSSLGPRLRLPKALGRVLHAIRLVH